MPRLLVLLPLLVAPFAASQDKKPPEKKATVLYSAPLVAKPGAKQKLVLRGMHLDAVTEVKATGDAKVKVLGAKTVAVPNNYPAHRVGDSEVEIELELPKDAKTVAVKVVAPSGESNLYTLLIPDDLPTVAEKEPNNNFDQAQGVALPCAIEGTIRSERDTDVYQFAGKKGEKIRVEVQAARFGSPVDALISLSDSNRAVVASTDDTDGSLDPAFLVTLPADGTYRLSVLDAHDLGGENFGYRLLLRREK